MANPYEMFPSAATTFGRYVDHIFFSLLGISSLVLLTLFIIIWVFVIRYRRGVEVPRKATSPRNVTLEASWTLIPLLIFIGLFIWAGERYLSLETAPVDALEIQVVAKQWMWKFQHPSGQRELNQLHIPLGQPIKLTLTTQDVIHSFYVPAFRAKQDLVPGRYTHIWFTPTRVGRYRLLCAEFCGTSHSQMRGEIVVMQPAAYEAWLDSRPGQPTLAEQGARLFRAHGCSGCHFGDSTVRAPSLVGVFGSTVPLQSGEIVVADEAYLRDSILLPKKQVVAGYAPVMPSFSGQLSEEAILKLIAYIQSLASTEESQNP